MDRTRLPGSRLGALAGIAFAVLLFLTVAAIDTPRGETDANVVAWWADSANQASATFSMYCAFGASLAFVVFLTQLCARLRTAEGGTAPVTAYVLGSGLLFAGLLLIAGILRGAVPSGVRLDEPVPGVDVLRVLPQLSYIALGPFAMLTASTFIAAVSWIIVRTEAFGRWLAWLGFVLAAVLLTSAVIGPWVIPVVLIWSIATSVALLRSGERAFVATAVPAS